MKSKYDRPAIKLEFFQSDFDDVQNFMKTNYSQDPANNKQVMKMTKWRANEKREMKMKIVEKALNKQMNKQANALQVPLEALMQWKKDVLELLLWYVQKYVDSSKDPKKKWMLDVSDAEKILKMFKTELGEPATIWANYNMNANKVEWLTDEETQALDILFSHKVKKPKKSSN